MANPGKSSRYGGMRRFAAALLSALALHAAQVAVDYCRSDALLVSVHAVYASDEQAADQTRDKPDKKPKDEKEKGGGTGQGGGTSVFNTGEGGGY